MSDINEAEEYEYSTRHKIRMNRLFRERVGGDFLPFPEVDSRFEQFRSKLVRTVLVIGHRIKKKCSRL